MTPSELSLLKDYFEEKFEHALTKIDTVDKKTDKILLQTTDTADRVGAVEKWQSKVEGTWSGANKATIFFAAAIGFIVNIVWDWFKVKL